jgi:hypothetical protein
LFSIHSLDSSIFFIKSTIVLSILLNHWAFISITVLALIWWYVFVIGTRQASSMHCSTFTSHRIRASQSCKYIFFQIFIKFIWTFYLTNIISYWLEWRLLIFTCFTYWIVVLNTKFWITLPSVLYDSATPRTGLWLKCTFLLELLLFFEFLNSFQMLNPHLFQSLYLFSFSFRFLLVLSHL